MMQVDVAEFGKDLPVYLNMVGTGEEVLIISHGKIIARMMPPSEDETLYLLSSPANAKRLQQAKKEIDDGNLIEIENIDDLDKLLA